jgi:hypothetical protein
MKKSLLILSVLLLADFLSAQVIPAMPFGYPTGTFKREQRIKTTFKTPDSKPNDLSANMRTVGKAYVSNPAKNKPPQSTVEFTYTEISGMRKEDDRLIDLGNPVEDKHNYAYKLIFNKKGELSEFEGRDVYLSAVKNDNIHHIAKGTHFTYFLHTAKAHKLGDVWTDSIFSFPLLQKFNTTFTFEKMDKTTEGKSVAYVKLSGNIKSNHKGMILDLEKQIDMEGNIDGFLHVDIKTNRIVRFKAEIVMKGKIENNEGKMQPYEALMKIHEWAMDPIGL